MRPELLGCGAFWLLASCLALAADTGAPPREFWFYYAEFGDARGELIDPLEFSEVKRLPQREAEQPSHEDSTDAADAAQAEEESDANRN